MKRITSYLVCTFVALALIGSLTTCVPEYVEQGGDYSGNGMLSVSATVSEPTLVTKAESVEALKEKQINTLDIFVEHVKEGETGKFISQYHLPLSTFPDGVPASAKTIGDNVKSFLKEHWRQEGLQLGEKYNIYVAANNTQTKGAKDLTSFNVAALRALVADEVTDGKALIDAANNIAAPWSGVFTDTPSGNVYKQYIEDVDAVRTGQFNAVYGFTADKEFMMDGILKNWTPVTGSKDQVFGFTKDDDGNQNNTNQPLFLNRAAAKFVLNVNFAADFLQVLSNEGVSITGTPGWKFLNFAFGAPVFAPETQGAGVQVHNMGTMLLHPYEYEGVDKHFQIITYSYPNKWNSQNYAEDAPSLVISVMYSDSNDPHYYRIPLVPYKDENGTPITAIERNHIYVINATIATKGSTVQEDVTVTENIQYAVLPWNDEANSAATHSEVQSVQHYYFNVNPKVYTLRGNGNQSIDLKYTKATGTKVNWKLFTYDDEGNQTGIVANDATGAVRAWFYDADGDFTTTYGDSNQNPWTNLGVTITQSTEGTSGSNGTITVTSTALTNKAIKYIRLRVYLDEVVDGQSLEGTYHEDILIRHFPTDNIQSIEGSWSSYHDANESTSTTIYTTTSLAEAQSLAEQYSIEFTSEEKTKNDPIDYVTWNANKQVAGYNRVVTEIERSSFTQNVWNNNRQGANSEANARLNNGYYYWGENPQSSNQYQNDYDYRTGGLGNRTYWRYSYYYRATYTHTYTYTEYTLNLPIPSTGDWVNWEDRESHSSERRNQYSYLGQNQYFNRFIAKVAINGNIRYIVENGTGYYGNNPPFTTEYSNTNTGLTNNHMYVIQISSTSEKYILGRPYVDSSTHQSDDDVVSPAFMIASQLGAVTTFSGRDNDQDNAADAANHCSRYLEVSEEGIYYTGWRLPTAAEIKVITEYQYGNIGGVTIPSQYLVLTPVLTGYYYWDLAGGAQRAWQATTEEPYYEGLTEKSYLRCVRDLSAEEIERLNGFDRIQEKYR